MSGPPDFVDEAACWLRFARQDLHDARTLLADEDSAPRNVCWHALQSAEKAIKAALIYEGVRFPKTHDLEVLARLIPSTWGLAQQCPDLSWLSHWGPDSRYPGDLEEGCRDDAERAIADASAILALASADLAARGVPGSIR